MKTVFNFITAVVIKQIKLDSRRVMEDRVMEGWRANDI